MKSDSNNLNYKKTVWIVDDDPSIKEAIKIILEEEGYQTTVFEDSQTLLTCLKNYSPHLILLDIVLGNEDGREIARILKSENRDLNIVLMSANNCSTDEIKESKADDYIRKPFELTELVETVSSFTKAQQ